MEAVNKSRFSFTDVTDICKLTRKVKRLFTSENRPKGPSAFEIKIALTALVCNLKIVLFRRLSISSYRNTVG